MTYWDDFEPVFEPDEDIRMGPDFRGLILPRDVSASGSLRQENPDVTIQELYGYMLFWDKFAINGGEVVYRGKGDMSYFLPFEKKPKLYRVERVTKGARAQRAANTLEYAKLEQYAGFARLRVDF